MRTFQTRTLTSSGLPNTIKAHVSLSLSIIIKRGYLPPGFVHLHLDHKYIFSLMALQPLWTLAAFSVSWSIGRTPSTGDQPVAMPLPTHRTTQTQNKRTQTSMPWMGFEPTIPVFERTKMVININWSNIKLVVLAKPFTLDRNTLPTRKQMFLLTI
jgi:hypothetical protein